MTAVLAATFGQVSLPPKTKWIRLVVCKVGCSIYRKPR
jgi:hypothetical protein